MEVWKDVRGYEGLYQVSDQGRVRSLDRINSAGKRTRGTIRKQTKNVKNGYLYVGLSKNGKSTNYSVHRLVAIAFIDNLEGLYTVNHKNENKEDNRACNLEWMSLSDNLKYGTHDERMRKNRVGKCVGTDHFNYGKYGKNSITHKGAVYGIGKYNSDDVVRFDTAADAARALKISTGQLCESIHNSNKSCGGYYWRRENG